MHCLYPTQQVLYHLIERKENTYSYYFVRHATGLKYDKQLINVFLLVACQNISFK